MSEDWKVLPKSAQMIYELLLRSSVLLDTPMIQSKVDYSMRTTRKSLKLLADMGLVETQRSLYDARKMYYRLPAKRTVNS